MKLDDLIGASTNSAAMARLLENSYDLGIKRHPNHGHLTTILEVSDIHAKAASFVVGIVESAGIADIQCGPFYFTDAEGHSDADLCSVILSILEGKYSYRAYSILPFSIFRRVELVAETGGSQIASDTIMEYSDINQLWSTYRRNAPDAQSYTQKNKK